MQAIALIDCNNFYASCEQMFDPLLHGKALVVLSNNDSCVIARSPEARLLNIKMGVPYFKIKKRLRQLGVAVRSSNYELYADMSRRLMNLLKKTSQEIEIYSIDEAFISIQRSSEQDLSRWAQNLRAVIYKNIGLLTSIGIGSSKGQAKVANYLSKTVSSYTGVFEINKNTNLDNVLEKIPVEEIWGIGVKSSKLCKDKGIMNAKQIIKTPNHTIDILLGLRGLQIQRELKGYQCLHLNNIKKKRNELCFSRSFSRPLENKKEMVEALCTYISNACEKLRREGLKTKEITIFLLSIRYKNERVRHSKKIKLLKATNNTNTIIKDSINLATGMFKKEESIVKLGVIMNHLSSIEWDQRDIFSSSEDTKKEERLIKTVDSINKQFGKGTLKWLSCGLNLDWQMRRNYLSKSATTRIMEIPLVKAC